jgi:superfamily II DNA or RNA helicase
VTLGEGGSGRSEPLRAERRRFSTTERAALYLAADGRCAECRRELDPGWHADHVHPHSRGGPTDVINGQALCPDCNLAKGVHMPTDLRAWQRDAIRKYDTSRAADFLVCATPGAGKTVLALTLARRLLDERTAQRVVVIVPTDALRTQWADEAAAFGIDLMPAQAPEDYDKTGYHGCVVTYAQLGIGAGADLLRRAAARVPTVALLDEIHHTGHTRAWGMGVQHALAPAVRRIGFTGTPWREDKNSPIPFVSYSASGKVVVDSSYEYGEAVADGVCRRIEFHAYDGEARWVDCGKVVTAEIGDELRDEDVPAVLDTILDPDREWMPGILAAAVESLRELRREVPDAGGLVIAERQWQAQKYARMLQQMTGEPALVAVSDDADAATRIEEFRNGRTPWLVAVRMVSEGVDIKRLAVGVYAAKTRTPLFFRQVVGRFVRTRPNEDINAKLFIPAVPAFTAHAKEIEDELRHQLDVERDRHEKATQEARDGQQMFELREPLSASEATFHKSIFGGQEASAEVHARAEAKARELGIPLIYAVNLIPVVLDEGKPVAEVTLTPKPPAEPRARREKMLRDEIKTLVGKVAHRARIEPQEVNGDLLRQGFPPRAKCGLDELERIRTALAEWLAEL